MRAGLAHISVPLLEGPTKPFVELGRQAARRALELDPTVAEAHAVLGRIMLHFDWDTEGATARCVRPSSWIQRTPSCCTAIP